MTSVAHAEPPRRIVVGVDTHKHVHVAVAINQLGVRLGQLLIPVDTDGYRQLDEWSATQGRVDTFGIEGTGSYGAGLTSYLRRQGHRIVEVNRGDRRARRANGKSDSLDAEAAARAVLNGTATAVPKTADGAAEMIRQIKVARDTAVKARTSAIITLKQIVVNSPAGLREQLDSLVRMRHHQPTIDYVNRRTGQGLTKRDIIRCLKRFVAREIYQRVMTDHHNRQQAAA
ncbi:hypothetical protein BH18ACT6_BH18ACT6_26250 [soil metagenome]